MNKIINSNKKEAEKLKRVLTQYKPKFDEVALCNAIMKDGKNETDKYSYQLLEAYIEAEKQFLLINLRSKQAMRINKDLEKVSRLEETIEGSVTEGKVTLNKLRLRISQNTNKQEGEQFWWYFVVVRHNETVLGTDFIAVFKPTIEKMVNPTIEFKETFTFDKVKSDFMIVVEVFGLFANSTTVETPIDGTLTPKQTKKLSLFKSIRHNLTPKTRRSQNSISDVDTFSTPPSTLTSIDKFAIDFNPRFRSYAKGFISLGNVKNGHCGAIQLESFDDACCLESKLTFRFGCTYSILRKLSSFITLTENNQPLWTRYWAVMKNDKLNLWLYPADEESDKPPLKSIDLYKLKGNTIMDNTDYSSCRPFTFHISTDGSNSTKIFSISCDNKEDAIRWKSGLFDQIQDLRSWQHSTSI